MISISNSDAATLIRSAKVIVARWHPTTDKGKNAKRQLSIITHKLTKKYDQQQHNQESDRTAQGQ